MKKIALRGFITIVFLLAFLILKPEVSYAQTLAYQYVGVWSSGSGTQTVTPPLAWAAFLSKGEELTGKGLRLVNVETIVERGILKYIGVWRNGTGSNLVTAPLAWSAFLTKGEELISQGLRLVDVETIVERGILKYIGVWRNGTGSNLVTTPLAWSAFLTKGEELISQGLRLIDVETILEGGIRKYIGVWRNGTGSNLITAPLALSAFQTQEKQLNSQGLVLVDLEMILEGGTHKYVGVWRNGTGSNLITAPLAWSAFQTQEKELISQGLRLVSVTAFQPPRSSPGTGTPPGSESFPYAPSYIKLTSGVLGGENYRIVVDFSRIIDDKPEITLPTQFLPELPTYGGKIIFPDNICGFKIIKPSRFLWLGNTNNVVRQHRVQPSLARLMARILH